MLTKQQDIDFSKFTKNMLNRLDQNDEKVGWSSDACQGLFLLERLKVNLAKYEEIRQIPFSEIMDQHRNSHYLLTKAKETLVDIANFAMMLFSQLEEQ